MLPSGHISSRPPPISPVLCWRSGATAKVSGTCVEGSRLLPLLVSTLFVSSSRLPALLPPPSVSPVSRGLLGPAAKVSRIGVGKVPIPSLVDVMFVATSVRTPWSVAISSSIMLATSSSNVSGNHVPKHQSSRARLHDRPFFGFDLCIQDLVRLPCQCFYVELH